MLTVNRWHVGAYSTPLPYSATVRHIGECLSQECVHLQVRDDLTNVSFNEQKCLVSPGKSGGRFVQGLGFQDSLGWPLTDAHCLTMERLPVHLQLSYLGFQQEAGGKAEMGPQHLNPSASTGEQSLVQKLHPSDCGSHFKGQIWVTWLPQLQGWMGKLRFGFYSLHRRGREQFLG